MLSYKFTQKDMKNLVESLRHHEHLFLMDASSAIEKMSNSANIKPSADELIHIQTTGTRLMAEAKHNNHGYECSIGKLGSLGEMKLINDDKVDEVSFTYLVDMNDFRKKEFEQNVNTMYYNALDALDDQISNCVLVAKPQYKEVETNIIPSKIYKEGRLVDNIHGEKLIANDIAITKAENGLPQPIFDLERATKTAYEEINPTFQVRVQMEKVARYHRPILDVTNALLAVAMLSSAIGFTSLAILFFIMSGLSWGVLEGFPIGRFFKKKAKAIFSTAWNLMLFMGLLALVVTLATTLGGVGIGILCAVLLLFRTFVSTFVLWRGFNVDIKTSI